MLIDTTVLIPDALGRFKRWGFLASDLIAECPDTGARLLVGDGRRKYGRPRRYFIKVPRVLLPAGYFDQEQIGTVTAYCDEDAIVKANARLARERRYEALEREYFGDAYLRTGIYAEHPGGKA